MWDERPEGGERGGRGWGVGEGKVIFVNYRELSSQVGHELIEVINCPLTCS